MYENTTTYYSSSVLSHRLTFKSSGLETSMRPWKVWIREFKETRNATRLLKKRGKKRYLSIPHSDLQEATSSATRKE